MRYNRFLETDCTIVIFVEVSLCSLSTFDHNANVYDVCNKSEIETFLLSAHQF